MKNLFPISLLFTLLCFTNACKKDDALPQEEELSSCALVTCNESETCVNGMCECEINDWSYLDWTMYCEDCADSLQGPVYFTLVLDTINVAVLPFYNYEGINSIENIRIQGAGVYSYKVLYENDTSYVLDEGNIQLIRCEATELIAFDE